MDRNVKPGKDIRGWLGLTILVGIIWYILVIHPLWDEFMSNSLLFGGFVFCLLGTVILWLVHIMLQARSWEDYGDEIRQWQADHDIRYAEQLIKATPAGKLMETYNIGGELGGEGEEVIGG